MAKKLSISLLVVVITLLITTPVLAAYYADIDVTESNGTGYDMLPVLVSLPIDYLEEHEFIITDGKDLRITDSQDNDAPFMLAEDKVAFASDITASKVNRFELTTGNTPLDSFAVCVGDGGYVTITDNANLELGNNFEIEFEGWIDTSEDNTLVEKPNACEIYTESGDVKAKIGAATTTVNLVPNGVGDYTNIAAQSPGSGSHWDKVDDPPASPDDDSTYIATASVTYEKDAYELSYDSNLDDAYILSVKIYFRVKSSAGTNYAQPYLRLGSSETTGTQISHSSTSYSTYSETLSRPGGGSWTYSDIQDLQVVIGLKATNPYTIYCTQVYAKVTYSPTTILVAEDVDAGERIVKVWMDGSDFGIDIDGVTEDTDPAVSVPNNGNGWVISNLPYMNYYKHTTSDTLRATYQPDSIIVGTTLPNEESPGTYDGTIAWGSNPAGISVSNSALQLEEAYYFEEIEPANQDIIQPETAQLITDVDLERLERNPFHPLVEVLADGTHLTERLVWLGGAWLILIVTFIAVLILSQVNITLTCAVGLGLSILFYSIGIFDYWVIIILGLGLLGGIIHERMPIW